MKSLLLNANDDLGWSSRFEVALRVARGLNGHLRCLQVIPYDACIAADGTGGFYVAPDVAERLQDIAAAHQGRVESRLRGENVAWDWVRSVGEPAKAMIQQSGLADGARSRRLPLEARHPRRTSHGPRRPADAGGRPE